MNADTFDKKNEGSKRPQPKIATLTLLVLVRRDNDVSVKNMMAMTLIGLAYLLAPFPESGDHTMHLPDHTRYSFWNLIPCSSVPGPSDKVMRFSSFKLYNNWEGSTWRPPYSL